MKVPRNEKGLRRSKGKSERSIQWPRQNPENWERPWVSGPAIKSPGMVVSSCRILVGICSCRANRDKREAVRSTWLSRDYPDIEAEFFVGGGTNSLPGEDDTRRLEAPDDYLSLPGKVLSYFRHALEHSDFEWLFKCDDDTYVALDRLHDLTHGSHDLAGNPFLRNQGYPSGGAGYMLKRAIVEKLVQARLPHSGAEDIIIGRAAISLGAKTFSTTRLCYDSSNPPRRENRTITCHWCSPQKLRAVHSILHDHPEKELQIVRRGRKHRLLLFKNGIFGLSEGEGHGIWSEQDRLQLKWEGGEIESLAISSATIDSSRQIMPTTGDPVRTRALIFGSIGDHASAPLSWFQGTHDIALVHYGDDSESSLLHTLQRKAKWFARNKGGKFQNLLWWLETHPSVIEDYDYFLIIDDDLKLAPDSLEKLIEAAECWDLGVCAPSQEPAGKISWPHLKKKQGTFIEFSNFVEMGCVLFHKESLRSFIETFHPVSENLVGWGTDFVISSACFDEKRPFGVIHTVSVLNPPRRCADKGIETLQPVEERMKCWSEIAGKFPIRHRSQVLSWAPEAPDIPVICINLKRAEERRHAMIDRWGPLMGDAMEFFEAFDRRDMDSERFEQPARIPGKDAIHRDLTTGEMACLLSHLEVHRRHADREKGILIMEDDVAPLRGAGNWYSMLAKAREEAPEVDVILLCQPINPFEVVAETESLHICGSRPPYGTTMVWFSPKGSSDFIRWREGLDAPADQWIPFCRERRLAVLKQPVAFHDGRNTYIGNTHRGASSQRKFIP